MYLLKKVGLIFYAINIICKKKNTFNNKEKDLKKHLNVGQINILNKILYIYRKKKTSKSIFLRC